MATAGEAEEGEEEEEVAAAEEVERLYCRHVHVRTDVEILDSSDS